MRRGRWLAAPESLEARALLTAQLQVIQSGTVPATVVEGQLLDETYQVSNVGTATATNVKFTDTLPTGVDYIAASTSVGTISQSGGTVTAPLGSLAIGDTVTVDIQMTPATTGSLENAVSVTASNATTQSLTTSTTADTASAGADLSVSGTSTPSQALPGNDLQYSFTIINNSTTNPAPGALLTTQLPGGVVFLSASVAGQNVGEAVDNNGVVTATLGDLGPAESETVTIDVMPTVAGSLTASGFATDVNGDTNLANNQQNESNTVNSTSGANTANLAVTTSAPGSLVVGQAGTYTITVTNNGGSSAANVKLWEQIPAGAQFVEATTSQGTIQVHDDADSFISANLGTLAQSASATITIVLTPTSTNSLSNQAEATTDAGLTNVPSAISTTSALLPGTGSNAVDLKVTTTPSATSAYIGQALTYTITLTNESSAIAHNVMLTAPLPPYLTFVSAASASGTTSTGAATGTLSFANGSLVDAIGNLGAAKSVTLTLVVTPNAATQLANTAVATSDSGVTSTTDSISQNTAANGTVPPSTAADLAVSISDSANGAAVTAGEQLTYTIAVKNQSAANSASNVVLSDLLPAAENFISDGATLGTINEAAGLVINAIGALAPGQSAVVQIVVDVTSNGTVSNTATATTDSGVVNPATITATDTSGTGSGSGGGGGGGATADLALTLAHSTDNGAIVPGQALTYTVTVTNTDASNTSSGVAITDNLPANVTFVSATSTVGSGSNATASGDISESNGVISDSLGSLAAGQTATFTIVVMPLASGSLSDSATVTSATTDPNPSNNSATDAATVSPTPATAATLALSENAAPTTVTAGGLVEYTITVSNSGTNAAANVVVTDQLPVGEVFDSGSSAVGSVSNSGSYVTASLGTLAAGNAATISFFVTPNVAGDIQNVSVVTTDSGVVDPTKSTAHATILVVGGGGGGGGEANLTVSNSPSATNPLAGQEVTYTITVTNAGTVDADSVVVDDVLPAGLTLVSETTDRGTISASGGSVTANVGLLTSQQTATITITAVANTAGTINDTALVATTSPENNPSPTATATITVGGGGSAVVAYLPGQPGDGTDATFINNLYRELLDRSPDSGSQAYWLSFLSAPGTNPVLQQAFMVQAILGTNEYQTHFVEMAYENFLFRLADPGGLQFFVGQLAAGVSEQLVIAEVMTAPEYELRHGGTTKGFVDGLYQDILGRTEDPIGEAFWVSLLDSGQVPAYVALNAFLGSTEAERLLLNNSTGSALDDLTVGGWNQLFFQGNLTANAQDFFFNQLAAQTPYQIVIRNMLETSQYFDASQVFLP